MGIRIGIICFMFSWYIIVRSVIYGFFLGCDVLEGWSNNQYSCGFFKFWWSFFEAVPVTALSIVLIGGVRLFIIRGSKLY